MAIFHALLALNPQQEVLPWKGREAGGEWLVWGKMANLNKVTVSSTVLFMALKILFSGLYGLAYCLNSSLSFWSLAKAQRQA